MYAGSFDTSVYCVIAYFWNRFKADYTFCTKEKEAAELKKKYFGPEGELYKKRESLMTPIQEEIYNAVKDISDQKGYSLILDRASDAGIIFANPKIDISNEVLTVRFIVSVADATIEVSDALPSLCVCNAKDLV